ncbi:MAG TPA: UDP-N-acetylmuramoyl-tripeptide--D-alanyl-D-alanine ligase, partial [Thermoleophilaceae bacterium]|nr:UDP-N-acetylmuramoyl-tripeptide--D-alanyl-D-alanine ligase [Thermoleophilaceae bacterium]
LVAGRPEATGPARAVLDSREVLPGDLFVGLPGAHADGGEFAEPALEAGAWGVLVAPAHAVRSAERAGSDQVVLSATAPLRALQSLARAWRRELGCPAVGITGSTGKTSTKDILAALLAPHLRTHSNRQNLNTEIGLPLSLLEAERGTEALVLEMAMRGVGQIAELVAITEPDVGLVLNVGPVHLEVMGTVEAVAEAKAELIRDLPAGATCVVPAGERLLAGHLREDLRTITFGAGGDVALRSFEEGRAEIDVLDQAVALDLSYDQPHNLVNTLAAVAVCAALGVRPEGRVEPRFSQLRGEVVELPGGVVAINDCYNANPMSMRAALEHLAASGGARRIAILGGMAELGADAPRFHREIGERAEELGIDVLVTVGELALPIAEGFGRETYAVGSPEEAGQVLDEIAESGDRVLVKGSRSVGLERILAPALSDGS